VRPVSGPAGVNTVPTTNAERIAGIVVFLDSATLSVFGLPPTR
jgi:hypothetical protein